MNPLHIAIIMDGNGRWAQQRGLPRTAGHTRGAWAVRQVVEAAARLHVGILTLYAFSSDNWSRPAAEVNALMRLLRRHLVGEAQRCLANNIRVAVIGRRDRLAAPVIAAIETIERQTALCDGLRLRLAIDYSARYEIARAARRYNLIGDATFARALAGALAGAEGGVDAVDLLIRTGGEQRLSDFLLWECAYAELLFLEQPWPEFGRAALESALADYRGRQRRFGKLVAPARQGGQCE